MRVIIGFTKGDEVRFVSHLDMQRLFQRAFKRAKLPLAYSQGFNPHPIMSFATALAVGTTSSCEYLDFVLTKELFCEDIAYRVNEKLPAGVCVVKATDVGDSKKSLTSAMLSATYSVNMQFDKPVSADMLSLSFKELLSNEIIVMKRTKGGIKPTDILPMVLDAKIISVADHAAKLEVKGKLTAEGGLNPEMLLTAYYEKTGLLGRHSINRDEIEFDWTVLL